MFDFVFFSLFFPLDVFLVFILLLQYRYAKQTEMEKKVVLLLRPIFVLSTHSFMQFLWFGFSLRVLFILCIFLFSPFFRHCWYKFRLFIRSLRSYILVLRLGSLCTYCEYFFLFSIVVTVTRRFRQRWRLRTWAKSSKYPLNQTLPNRPHFQVRNTLSVSGESFLMKIGDRI